MSVVAGNFEYFANKPKRRVKDAEAAGAFIITNADGSKHLFYEPSSQKHRDYHASTRPNLLMEGRRGTGKSFCARMDFHMRALAVPGFTYLILRRTMPELRKSHLLFIDPEMNRIATIPGFESAHYLKGASEAHYGNGSVGLFGHCETDQDIEKYLSAQFAAIFFDEITTFPWEMVTRIASSCRVEADSDVTAILRAGTNPIGVSAEEVARYFITKDVTPDEDPDYAPDDWENIHLVAEDNPNLDFTQYDKRFAGLPAAYRKAWMDGVWGVEGAYFSIETQHLINAIPRINGPEGYEPLPALMWPWLHIYRIFDWGFNPDPAVCLWVAVLPNGREIPFLEESWIRTPAAEVATDIKRLSDGMHIVTTFADPTMWVGEKEMDHCLADEFEETGIPLTRAKNDRTAAGFAIQNHLNTMLADGAPQLQIFEQGTPMLVRALRAMRVDKKRPGRIADHKMDHLPICLGYFCMAGVNPTLIPRTSAAHRWMVPKAGTRHILGNDAIRGRR